MKTYILVAIVCLKIEGYYSAGYPNCGAVPENLKISQAAGAATKTLENPWATVFLKNDGRGGRAPAVGR